MKKAILITLIGIYSTVKAQIPVEISGGHERTSIDIMFFKYFKNKLGENSDWLFFNRNRASIDYRMTESTFLPQFGFTEAISYNHKKLKGFAPVLVGQVFNRGIFPKAGIQYVQIKKELTIFTWLVCETLEGPALDYFLLFRYTPKLSEKISMFSQVESVNTFPTVSMENSSFTQRLRLGLSFIRFQFGVSADFNQTGKNTFLTSYNVGGFIRYEF
jgi:hypothetical protein